MTSSTSCCWTNLILLISFQLVQIASSLSSSPSTNTAMLSPTSPTTAPKLITISEHIWRKQASTHSHRIRHLLQPGLTPLEQHDNNSGKANRRRRQQHYVDDWTALDPVNPIYNFLIEYYGLKGAKGPRRLARWAPDPKLLWGEYHGNNEQSAIQSSLSSVEKDQQQVYQAAMKASNGLGGILLENATIDDLGGTLHMRGGVPVPMMCSENDTKEPQLHGVLYNPAVFYNRHLPLNNNNAEDKERKLQLLKTIAPFQWYTSILRQTLSSDPILHCYGLHEWAMQYHPKGADPPPSAKYQSSLNLRVSRQVINDTVERKGIRCTHVDALRFFAPAAGPLNHHGASLQRMDQLRLEQKGCVHAHMDLLKIGLKLQGFIDSELMGDILEIALEARTLDVEASPYDATAYGVGIVPIETNEGRRVYRERQIGLMKRAEPVRQRLLDAYEVFMRIAFDESLLVGGVDEFVGKRTTTDDEKSVMTTSGSNNNGDGPYVAPERLALAEPGGLPWRKNLIEKS